MSFNVNIHSTTPFRMISYWRNKSDRAAMRELDRLRTQVILETRRKALQNIIDKVQYTAANDFMANDGGAPKPNITTSRTQNLRNAVLNKNHSSHVEKITTTASGTKFRAVFGVKDDKQTPYASSQEVGITITKTDGKMSFYLYDGSFAQAQTVTLEPRPYMQPALDKVMGNGTAVELVDFEIQKIINQMNFFR